MHTAYSYIFVLSIHFCSIHVSNVLCWYVCTIACAPSVVDVTVDHTHTHNRRRVYKPMYKTDVQNRCTKPNYKHSITYHCKYRNDMHAMHITHVHITISFFITLCTSPHPQVLLYNPHISLPQPHAFYYSPTHTHHFSSPNKQPLPTYNIHPTYRTPINPPCTPPTHACMPTGDNNHLYWLVKANAAVNTL